MFFFHEPRRIVVQQWLVKYLNGLCAFGVYLKQIQHIDAQNQSYTLRWKRNMEFFQEKNNRFLNIMSW